MRKTGELTEEEEQTPEGFFIDRTYDNIIGYAKSDVRCNILERVIRDATVEIKRL